ncbi:hypothetical protein HDU97_001349 [Phlyctochytrium planicorne]|nr:hypothetical protein HDU97_001349 [Phlyctochytrium planicorne]
MGRDRGPWWRRGRFKRFAGGGETMLMQRGDTMQSAMTEVMLGGGGGDSTVPPVPQIPSTIPLPLHRSPVPKPSPLAINHHHNSNNDQGSASDMVVIPLTPPSTSRSRGFLFQRRKRSFIRHVPSNPFMSPTNPFAEPSNPFLTNPEASQASTQMSSFDRPEGPMDLHHQGNMISNPFLTDPSNLSQASMSSFERPENVVTRDAGQRRMGGGRRRRGDRSSLYMRDNIPIGGMRFGFGFRGNGVPSSPVEFTQNMTGLTSGTSMSSFELPEEGGAGKGGGGQRFYLRENLPLAGTAAQNGLDGLQSPTSPVDWTRGNATGMTSGTSMSSFERPDSRPSMGKRRDRTSLYMRDNIALFHPSQRYSSTPNSPLDNVTGMTSGTSMSSFERPEDEDAVGRRRNGQRPAFYMRDNVALGNGKQQQQQQQQQQRYSGGTSLNSENQTGTTTSMSSFEKGAVGGGGGWRYVREETIDEEEVVVLVNDGVGGGGGAAGGKVERERKDQKRMYRLEGGNPAFEVKGGVGGVGGKKGGKKEQVPRSAVAEKLFVKEEDGGGESGWEGTVYEDVDDLVLNGASAGARGGAAAAAAAGGGGGVVGEEKVVVVPSELAMVHGKEE